MTLWKITGLAERPDGGGRLTVWAITQDRAIVPDPHRALAEVDGQAEWFEVDELVAVGTFPTAWSDQSGAPNLIAAAEALEAGLQGRRDHR